VPVSDKHLRVTARDDKHKNLGHERAAAQRPVQPLVGAASAGRSAPQRGGMESLMVRDSSDQVHGVHNRQPLVRRIRW
jgi:hypothetical protein